MVALLGVEGDWDSREAKLRHEAELEHERQIGVMRNFLEGQIADKSKQLDQYRVEAGDYKTSVESEAERYKKTAEEEIQRVVMRATHKLYKLRNRPLRSSNDCCLSGQRAGKAVQIFPQCSHQIPWVFGASFFLKNLASSFFCYHPTLF